MSTPENNRVKLWDAPIRIVHWSFVALLPALWWTSETGDIATHRLLGYTMLGLVVFRLYWGFAGGTTARFAGFVRGPRAVAGYVKRLVSREGESIVGHNPLGGWSVIALLLLLLTQVLIGLFTQDVDGLESGPLTHLVSYDFADAARGWHGWLFNILLGLVGLHVVAILFYLLFKRDNLVSPMITGHRRLPAHAAPAHAPLWRGLLGVALAGGTVWWVSMGCPLPA